MYSIVPRVSHAMPIFFDLQEFSIVFVCVCVCACVCVYLHWCLCPLYHLYLCPHWVSHGSGFPHYVCVYVCMCVCVCVCSVPGTGRSVCCMMRQDAFLVYHRPGTDGSLGRDDGTYPNLNSR